MQTIICFFDAFEIEEENWVQEHDLESNQIHLYTDCVVSSENNPFYCLGEIATVTFQTEGKRVFVTNHNQIAEWVTSFYSMYFDEIIHIPKNSGQSFKEELLLDNLIQYESQLMLDRFGQQLILDMRELRTCHNVAILYNQMIDVGNELLKGMTEARNLFWQHYFKVYLYTMETQFCDEEIMEYCKLALLQVQAFLSRKGEDTARYLSAVLQADVIQAEQSYFVWNQLKALSLNGYLMKSDECSSMLDQLYQKGYDELKAKLKDELVAIPLNERDKDCVVIFTIQYLGENHAPTKTVRERCQAFCEMGKTVYLINTREQCTSKGEMPGALNYVGNVMSEMDGWSEITLDNGMTISCYQASCEMPDIAEIKTIYQFVKKVKPYYVLSVGTGSLVADCLEEIVPVFPLALAFSTVPKTKCKHAVIGRELNEEERLSYQTQGLEVISSCFTFQLKAQTEHYTREQFHLPENKFLICITGIRLDSDVSEEFITKLEPLLTSQMHLVFAGKYNSYPQVCEQHPTLKEQSTFIGYCNDMLALMEIMDFYMNPPRLGGGFSVIEAFAKGVPGLYFPTGDVYVAGGDEFIVSSYEELGALLKRYQTDAEFYSQMAIKAKKRAELMTDSVRAMKELDASICDVLSNL